jgi:hypothetical protein
VVIGALGRRQCNLAVNSMAILTGAHANFRCRLRHSALASSSGPSNFFGLETNESRFSSGKFPTFGGVVWFGAAFFLSRLHGAFGVVTEPSQHD